MSPVRLDTCVCDAFMLMLQLLSILNASFHKLMQGVASYDRET